MMASRWAFEAFMVTQFRDNPFGKIFFDDNRKSSIAKYKRDYYVPALESKLELVLSQPGRWRDNSIDSEVQPALSLLQAEIKNELSYVGMQSFPEVDRLAVGKFDSAVFAKTARFLAVLKDYYAIRASNARKSRDDKIAALTSTPEKMAAYHRDRQRYTNEAVTLAVEKSSEPTRIVEWKGELVQKIFPIYFQDHKPRHALDFTAHFYSPEKHFVGQLFDTLYFNLAVIWTMTVLLYLALYFEWLKKAVLAIENWRKYRRRLQAGR
jgi:hypothetical protein